MIWSPAPLRLPTRGEWSGDCFLCVCEWMHDLRIRWDFDWPISLSSRWAPLGANRSSTSVSSTYALPLQAALDVDCVVKHTRSVGELWRESERERERPSWSVVSVLQIVARNYRLHFDSYSIRRRQSVSLPTWPALTQHLPRYLLHPTYPFRTLFRYRNRVP